ncbi:MAG: 3-hydroxyisobutyrate dehydrogenase [Alphaproteobacteria bacterium]|nr:3-hydroxyisobutyrate dehydrogenase [Alphaproteobacteria bacterium]
MATIGFIGLGNMGGPMARNLLKAGHEVQGFDVVKANADAHAAAGGIATRTAADAVKGAEFVITMLPAGEHVRSVYTGEGGVIGAAGKGTLLIDSSTIDVASARVVAVAAGQAGFPMLDAPVSGGVTGAEAGTLTFMVGGPEQAFQRGLPILQAMGKNIVHAGAAGNGQAAKICNNMILGVAMIAVSEGFLLAEKLGLDAQKLFDISSKSSGQCWAMTSYCPVPGPVPASPANRNYKAGFTTAMMLKDLVLAQQAAAAVGVATPMGALAQSLQSLNAATGQAGLDFSSVVNMLRGGSGSAGLS